MKKLLFLIPLLFLAACSTVTTDGPYKGDTFLYHVDKTIKSAYVITDEFLKLEMGLRLADHPLPPEVTQAADKIRADFPRWLASAKAFRDAYLANPNQENKNALMKSLDMLQLLSNQALQYLITHQKGN